MDLEEIAPYASIDIDIDNDLFISPDFVFAHVPNNNYVNDFLDTLTTYIVTHKTGDELTCENKDCDNIFALTNSFDFQSFPAITNFIVFCSYSDTMNIRFDYENTAYIREFYRRRQ